MHVSTCMSVHACQYMYLLSVQCHDKGYHVSKCIIRHVVILSILDYASLAPTFPKSVRQIKNRLPQDAFVSYKT